MVAMYLPLQVTYEKIDDTKGEQNDDLIACYVLLKVEHIRNKCRSMKCACFAR
jgi:hypothetical protein